MASLAASASPSMLVNLKKRGRHLTSDYDFDLPRNPIKRCRATTPNATDNAMDNVNAIANGNANNATNMNPSADVQIALIRAECEQFVKLQNAELQRYQAEVARLTQHVTMQEQETQRLQQENKLLKRAIAIQNQHKGACEQENQRFRELAVEATEHIKRLEQTNYALQVHLQTSTQASRGGPTSHLPDVF